MKKPMLVLLALFLYMLPQTVSAHAVLTASDPGQGDTVTESMDAFTLTFNSDVEDVVETKINVDGQALATDSAVIDGTTVTVPLAQEMIDGEYDFSYKVISADGHEVGNTVSFTAEGLVSAEDSDNSVEESAGNSEQNTQVNEQNQAAAEKSHEEEGSDTGFITTGLVIIALLCAAVLFFTYRKKD
ncbi:copper resistance protein CopC [Terribacillus saccharophilus]|uniref:copper resistance CopC family protein n=1 Tax=Terribacillus saccharophilus TaxID=361277 RepID=UPI0039827260